MSKALETVRLVNRLLHMNNKRIKEMSEATDRIRSEVEQVRTVNQSVIALFGTLADEIRTNAANEEALLTLADDLDSQSNELASAVTANTPAAGETGGGTPTPTPTDDTGGDTPTPTPTNDTGGDTPTPTPTDDTGGDTPTPTPTNDSTQPA